MHSINFPAFSAHVTMHRWFTSQTLKWFDEFQSHQLDAASVLETILQWLLEHITQKDADIASFCRSKGIDCTRFVHVVDVLPIADGNHVSRIPVEVGVGLLCSPLLFYNLFLASTGWPQDLYFRVGLMVAINIGVLFFLIMYVRQTLHARTQMVHLAHARQLADNMLAGEIALRIAVLDLEDVDCLFAGEDSSLVSHLRDIVEHVRLFLPYIPDAVLSIVRGEEPPLPPPSPSSARKRSSSSPALISPKASERRKKGLGVQINPELRVCSERHFSQSSSTAYVQNKDEVFTPVGPDTSRQSDVDAHKTLIQPIDRDARDGSLSVSPCTPSALSSSGRGAAAPIANPLLKPTSVSSIPLPATGSTGGDPAQAFENGVASFRKASRRESSWVCPNAIRRHSSVTSLSVKTKNLLQAWLLRKTVSVLVADFNGFIALSSSLPIEELLPIHSAYVSLVETVSKATKGNLMDVLGDRVILSWNASTSVGDYAVRACGAALALQSDFSNEPILTGHRCKMAIATGQALVGSLGSRTHLSFGILGHVMLIASALCKLNGPMNTTILICANTWRNAKEFYAAKILTQFDLICGPSCSPAFGLDESTTTTPLDSAPSVPPPSSSSQLPNPTCSSLKGSLHFWPSLSSCFGPDVKRLFALELKHALRQPENDDEWMYALQNSDHPFEDYNQAVLEIFYGDVEKGKATLQEFLQSHPDDNAARRLIKRCNLSCYNGAPSHTFVWTYGWHPPWGSDQSMSTDLVSNF